MYETLKQVPLFAGLSDEDLEHLCRESQVIELESGEVLFEEGDPGESAYVIDSGEIEIVKKSSDRDVLLAVRKPQEVIGEMALLDQSPRTATARARGKASLITVAKSALDELLAGSNNALRVVFRTVLERWQGTEALLRQSERMAQLGTLTAGVAHELNNPAAGVHSAAANLGRAVDRFADARARLEADLPADVKSRVHELLERVRAEERPRESLSPLEMSDRETDLEDWLEARRASGALEHTPALVSMDVDTDALTDLVEGLESVEIEVAVAALGAAHEVHELIYQIEQGAARISAIVSALKSYSYLDQAPEQDVDVTKGIDDTLLILGSKLKGIAVHREYQEDLPLISAFGSELNQVWTNLIDNAASALAEAETPDPAIGVRVFTDNDDVVVEVEDNGPGIPAENLERVFDAFFTTKPPGSGTGLGLNISYGIVVNKHRGDMSVASEPGKTVFRVELPVNAG